MKNTKHICLIWQKLTCLEMYQLVKMTNPSCWWSVVVCTVQSVSPFLFLIGLFQLASDSSSLVPLKNNLVVHAVQSVLPFLLLINLILPVTDSAFPFPWKNDLVPFCFWSTSFWPLLTLLLHGSYFPHHYHYNQPCVEIVVSDILLFDCDFFFFFFFVLSTIGPLLTFVLHASISYYSLFFIHFAL